MDFDCVIFANTESIICFGHGTEYHLIWPCLERNVKVNFSAKAALVIKEGENVIVSTERGKKRTEGD